MTVNRRTVGFNFLEEPELPAPQVSEAQAGLAVGTTRIMAMAGDDAHGLLAAASFANKSKRLIGLGWKVQMLDEVIPADPWDVPLDGFASPSGLEMFR